MAAILLLSAGIPMLHAGMDFMKSKRGENNTYLNGELNALPYTRRQQFAATHDYFRGLIALRLSPLGSLLRLDGVPTPSYWMHETSRSALALGINADHSRGVRRMVFAINPHFEPVVVAWPMPGPLGHPKQLLDQERVALHGLESARLQVDEEGIHLPPMSCGLWQC